MTSNPTRWIAGALVALCGLSSQAAPITLQAGQSVVLNFDLSSASPGPTFDSILFTVERTGPYAYGTWFFDDLDAAGTMIVNSNAVGGTDSVASTMLSYAGIRDGVFSVEFVALVDDDVVDVYAVGLKGTAQTDRFYGVVSQPGGSVPEPTSLALAGLALAGAGLARRRRAAAA